MKLLRAIVHFFAVAAFLVTTTVPLSVATPARADTFDGIAACMKTVAGSQIAAAKIASKLSDGHFLQCTSQIAGGDMVMIAIAGALTALAVGGEIKSEDDCNQKINAIIGMLLVKVLLSSDAVKSILGEDVVEMLKTYVSGNGASLLSQIPALSTIFNEITCGCSVAGVSVEVKQQLIDLYNNANECGSFAAEVGEAFVDGLESGIDAAGNLLSDATCVLSLGLFLCDDDETTASGSDPQPLPTPPPCIGAMTPKSAYAHGSCTCNAPKAKTFSADGKSVSCTICPPGQGRNDKGVCASCPPGKKVGPDTYGHCSNSYSCAPGTHFNATNTGCDKDCGEGAVMEGGSCKTCAANERPEYVNTGTSAGKCVSCGDGYWSYAGDDVCYSKCSSSQEWKNNTCVNKCMPGTRLNTSEFGGLCEECEQGKESNDAATACVACPANSTWTPLATGGGRCICPKGTKESGGVCSPCAKGTTWSSDAAGEHCNAPPGFPCGSGQKHDAMGKCVAECGANAINDKANPNKCVPCAKGELAFGGVCMNVTAAPATPTNGNLKPVGIPALSCPDGMQVNSSGNGCTKKTETPDPAKKCKLMGANYVISNSSRDGCKKCPFGKTANLSRTICIVGLRSAPNPAESGAVPPIDPPATRAPMPAPHPNTSGGIR